MLNEHAALLFSESVISQPLFYALYEMRLKNGVVSR